MRQYKIVLNEEDKVFAQKRKAQDEYVCSQGPCVNQHAMVYRGFPCLQSGDSPLNFSLGFKIATPNLSLSY